MTQVIEKVSHFATGGVNGTLVFSIKYEGGEIEERIISPSHKNFVKIIDAIKNGKTSKEAFAMVELGDVYNLSNGTLTVDVNDNVSYQTKDMKEPYSFGTSANTFLLKMLEQGFDMEPFIKFSQGLVENPSFNVNNNAFRFIDRNMFAIDEDGFLLAYKVVKSDYMDIHSGTISNKIGTTVSMPRNEVNDNPNITCAEGLHACGRSYIKGGGKFGESNASNRLILVRIDPRNIVSIPTDYNGAKMRVCEYQVVGEINKTKKDELVAAVQKLEELRKGDVDEKQVEIQDLQTQIANLNGNWFS